MLIGIVFVSHAVGLAAPAYVGGTIAGGATGGLIVVIIIAIIVVLAVRARRSNKHAFSG